MRETSAYERRVPCTRRIRKVQQGGRLSDRAREHRASAMPLDPSLTGAARFRAKLWIRMKRKHYWLLPLFVKHNDPFGRPLRAVAFGACMLSGRTCHAIALTASIIPTRHMRCDPRSVAWHAAAAHVVVAEADNGRRTGTASGAVPGCWRYCSRSLADQALRRSRFARCQRCPSRRRSSRCSKLRYSL